MTAALEGASVSLNQQVANVVVQEHKRLLGRGPKKAQAFYRRNVVVVLMEDALTEAERRLAASGEPDVVLQMRQRYQELMRPALLEAILGLTGCHVEAFMSANHISPDVAAEVFVLDRPIAAEPAQARETG